MKTPCELIFWNGLPTIRKELAESLVHQHDFNQKETAEALGITPAAVSQYLSKKRGKVKIVNKKILKEINESAEIIKENGKDSVVTETCRICRILRKEGVFQFFSGECICKEK